MSLGDGCSPWEGDSDKQRQKASRIVTIRAENEQKPGDHLQLEAGPSRVTQWDDQVPVLRGPAF